MRTVIGVLPSVSEAQHVAHEFEVMGIARNEINVVPAAADSRELRKVDRSKRSNAAAAQAGALRGVALGLVLGGLMLSLPGVRPFLAGSAIATLAAECCIVASLMSLMAAVSNMGQLHEEAALFEEAVHERGVVVAAHVTENRESVALKVLGENHARDVLTAAEVSRLSRWTAMFENPNPYPCDSQVVAHSI
ncbi:MAG TPA: hypothetical protein VK789_00435 [Bryobacteraceae bacterium]|jgi:hypothetical protein|nr:hypothetical protein [Bryobacteraceae bacterium]